MGFEGLPEGSILIFPIAIKKNPPAKVETNSRGTINYVQNWREVWAKERVAVYCSSKTVTKSSIIDLFHQEPFKRTIGISGKDRPNSEPKAVSYVWHRMLPVESQNNGQKFSSFIKKLQQQGLSLIWGKNPSIG